MNMFDIYLKYLQFPKEKYQNQRELYNSTKKNTKLLESAMYDSPIQVREAAMQW